MADADRMEWLAGELRKIVDFLEQYPHARPTQKDERAEAYAAGLYDMAKYLLDDKIQHDINWQELRAWVAEAGVELPQQSSSFEIIEGEPQDKATNPWLQ